MTEQEWLACTDPTPMLTFLADKASHRKMRLFAVGSCRRIWSILEEDCRKALQIAEQFADGDATKSELDLAYETAVEACGDFDSFGGSESTPSQAVSSAACPTRYFTHFVSDAAGRDAALSHVFTFKTRPASLIDYKVAERAVQASLFRCAFGNPFRPVSLSPAWLTPTVASLAQAIYDERAFNRLPILADALEEAGCTDAEVLAHCREPGEHIRGCWVVDLALGRE